MVEIDTWVAGGYKVRAFDWVDGKSIYLHIDCFRPGASLSAPPAKEKSVLLPLNAEPQLRNYLNSIVIGLMEGSKKGICVSIKEI